MFGRSTIEPLPLFLQPTKSSGMTVTGKTILRRTFHPRIFIALVIILLFTLFGWLPPAKSLHGQLSCTLYRDSLGFSGPKKAIVQLPHQVKTNNRITKHALNSTLDFQKVFVLNLARRTDRRDLISLMAIATDIEIEYFEATDGDAVQHLHLPNFNIIEGLAQRNFTFSQGQLGCYRSNLNIMRHIVENQVHSALIIQDDADWDIDFRPALAASQEPLRILLDSLQNRDMQAGRETFVSKKSRGLDGSSSAWQHQDWDILWLGASYEYPWPDPSNAPYISYRDDTVTSANFSEPGGKNVFPAYGISRPESSEDPGYRIIQQSRQPLGMAAYAVTLSGAAKILARAGKEITQPYDSTICSMSRPNAPEGYRRVGCVISDPVKPKGEAELRSISFWPPLVSQFRTPDGQRDSDLHNNRPKSQYTRDTPGGFALDIKRGIREHILSQKWSL